MISAALICARRRQPWLPLPRRRSAPRPKHRL